jgi:hypothetical protein
MTSRAPAASCSRSASGIDGAPAVTTMPSPGFLGGQAEAAVTNAKVDAFDAEVGQAVADGIREIGMALDGRHLRPEACEHRRLVAGAGADLEDPVTRLDCRSSVIRATMYGWLMSGRNRSAGPDRS